MKKCTKCGEEKPLTEFHVSKNSRDGYNPHCKGCRKKERQTPASKQAEADRLLWPDGHKRCSGCGEIKPHAMFYPNARVKDGLYARCNTCCCEQARIYHIEHRNERRAYAQEWAKSNTEKISHQRRQYHASNREKSNTRSLAWREANPERARENDRQWHANNRARVRAYRSANRERYLFLSRRLRATHPERFSAYNHRRRARLAAVGGRGITEQDIQAMIYCQQGLCAYCERDGQKLTLDHVIPLDQNGLHDPDNAVMCCGVCNSSKGNRTPEQWTDRWYLR